MAVENELILFCLEETHNKGKYFIEDRRRENYVLGFFFFLKKHNSFWVSFYKLEALSFYKNR